jgi:hypothetical protein
MTGRPDACAQCGAPLIATGRFCSNCGSPVAPVNLRTAPPAPVPEAEPTEPTTPVDPYESLYAAPPPIAAPPPAHAATTPPPQTTMSFLAPTPPPATPVAEPLPTTPAPARRGSPGPGLWIGAALLLAAVLFLGSYLLLHGSGDATTSSDSTPLVPKATHSAKPDKASASSTPSSTPASSRAPAVNGKPTEVAGLAEASAPNNAPPGVDFSGQTVTYVPGNMVDGRADTTWRVPGNATGTELTFHLAQPTKLTEVGLINGYDKIAFSGGRQYDWYTGNRRILSVQWIFDDGTTVDQQLGTSRAMQTTPIDPVTTQTVRMRIVSVTPPGHGPAARNDTAVSEVSLKGVAQ